jgi:hypothetical protein
MLANALVAQAQTSPLPQRDPTLPPASVGADLAGDGSTPAVALPLRVNGSNVVVREGKPFLVVGSRLVAPGQTVESYRLERITETEIWLRDASGITKVARFAGVQRQAASTQCVAKPPVTPPSAKKPAKKALPAKRATAHPPPSKTGAAAPRPIRENNAHDC